MEPNSSGPSVLVKQFREMTIMLEIIMAEICFHIDNMVTTCKRDDDICLSLVFIPTAIDKSEGIA